MEFVLQGGSERQRAWFSDAIAACTFPLDRLQVSIPVTWVSDPSTSMKDEVAYTTYGPPTDIKIQNELDQGKGAPDGKTYEFYIESVVHELGHIITSVLWSESDRSKFSGLMGGKYPDDWERGQWVDHLEETAAELFKDFYLPKQKRVFSNRTNWRLKDDARDPIIKLMQSAIAMETVLIINSRISTVEGAPPGGDT